MAKLLNPPPPPPHPGNRVDLNLESSAEQTSPIPFLLTYKQITLLSDFKLGAMLVENIKNNENVS